MIPNWTFDPFLLHQSQHSKFQHGRLFHPSPPIRSLASKRDQNLPLSVHYYYRLHSSFGISGPVLSCFSSYLNNRSQFISVNGATSKLFDLQYGVPQGCATRVYCLSSMQANYLAYWSIICQTYMLTQTTLNSTSLSNQTQALSNPKR